MLYHSNCDDVKDDGWGCCYRSFQNLMQFHGVEYPMQTLVEKLGSEHWLEPAELIPVLPDGFKAHTFLWCKNFVATKHMKRTTPNQYKLMGGSARSCVERVVDRYGAIVLDNGTYAYCLLKSGDLLDPHCYREDRVRRKINLELLLHPDPCWMMLAVEKISDRPQNSKVPRGTITASS